MVSSENLFNASFHFKVFGVLSLKAVLIRGTKAVRAWHWEEGGGVVEVSRAVFQFALVPQHPCLPSVSLQVS